MYIYISPLRMDTEQCFEHLFAVALLVTRLTCTYQVSPRHPYHIKCHLLISRSSSVTDPKSGSEHPCADLFRRWRPNLHKIPGAESHGLPSPVAWTRSSPNRSTSSWTDAGLTYFSKDTVWAGWVGWLGWAGWLVWADGLGWVWVYRSGGIGCWLWG